MVYTDSAIENCGVWAHLGSNQGPTGYEPVALPAELWARKTSIQGLRPNWNCGILEYWRIGFVDTAILTKCKIRLIENIL